MTQKGWQALALMVHAFLEEKSKLSVKTPQLCAGSEGGKLTLVMGGVTDLSF